MNHRIERRNAMVRSMLLVLSGAALATVVMLLGTNSFAEEDTPADTVEALRFEMPGMARWGTEFKVVELHFAERGITFKVYCDKQGNLLPGWPGGPPRAVHEKQPFQLGILKFLPEESREQALQHYHQRKVRVPREMAERIFKLAETQRELDAFQAKVEKQGSDLATEAIKAGLLKAR
jgi:hypothetical protein